MPTRRQHPTRDPAIDARRRTTCRWLAGLALGGSGGAALAQDPLYPSKAIRIVPFGTAGGPIDTIARLYGERLPQRWGQPVVVDAKPGASGIVAASNPAGNLTEFVAWAKAKGRVTYGTWGNGSAAHLYGELLKRQTGAPLEHVPYKGEAAAHLDMLGGVLDIAWANPATARNLLAGGKIKVLGITGNRRVGTLPQVPTFAEQGIAGFVTDSWVGSLAAARAPRAVVDKLVAALREITQAPEVRAKLLDMGFEPLGNGPDDFAAAQKAELPQWAALVKAAGVMPE